MKSYSVMRTHSSPYHGPDFANIEQNRLNLIPGVSFRNRNDSVQPVPTVLITNTHTRLRELPASLLAGTKLIIHSNSGYDHFNQERDLWINIPVIIGHEIRAQAVAEYYLSALFTGLLEMPQHLAWSKSRAWERPLIKDQEVLIFGYGHIGKIIEATLKALGARVTVVDPFVSGRPHLEDIADYSKARIVLACCSLNSSSYHLFNESFFQWAHPELLFINGARGKLVDEKALRDFLLSHPQAQAFLDVFEEEPFQESWHHFPQVWKTSHIAGVYSDLDEAIIQFEEKVLRDFTQMGWDDFKTKYSEALLQNKWIKGELI